MTSRVFEWFINLNLYRASVGAILGNVKLAEKVICLDSTNSEKVISRRNCGSDWPCFVVGGAEPAETPTLLGCYLRVGGWWFNPHERGEVYYGRPYLSIGDDALELPTWWLNWMVRMVYGMG